MSPYTSPITCEQFEANVSDYIDGALSAGDRALMEMHQSHCAGCSALLAEVRAIVADAAQLPQLSPTRDLWTGIADQLDTPVVSIGTTDAPAVRQHRTVSFRMFVAAAVLIVAASSGATYWLTRVNPVGQAAAPVASVPTTPFAQDAATPDTVTQPTAVATTGGRTANIPNAALTAAPSAVVATGATAPTATRQAFAQTSPASTRQRFTSNNSPVELVYEREISAMRRMVDERLGDLDSSTVVEIERNLRIIDKAISDSRRALQNDPRSRFLSTQLDRALETKLSVLRRIALL